MDSIELSHMNPNTQLVTHNLQYYISHIQPQFAILYYF